MLTPGSRGVLDLIKRLGPVDVADLASALGTSQQAVRQHLVGLVAGGLVTVTDTRGRIGRPRRLYSICASAESLFPKTYDEFGVDLLDAVDTLQPSLVKDLFEYRRRRRVEEAKRRLDGLPFDDRVTELGRILDEDGYLAEVARKDDDTWLIVEHNCAILEIAVRYGQACSTELSFLREVLDDARIDRVSHMVAGDLHCGYCIERSPTSRSGRRRRQSSRPSLNSLGGLRWRYPYGVGESDALLRRRLGASNGVGASQGGGDNDVIKFVFG